MADFGNIDIQASELRGLSDNIKAQRRNLEEQFQAVANQMTSLEGNGWDSEAGRALRVKFNKLRDYYVRKYPPAMESYMNFLNKTADSYEKAEMDRMKEVENLSNMGQK